MTKASYSGRAVILPKFSFEPTVTLDWVHLPYGDFTARILGTRVVVTPSPRTAIFSLIQYNQGAHSLSSSVRLRWEYTPSSHVFVVCTDGRDTLGQGAPELLNRALAVKVTRLLRF